MHNYQIQKMFREREMGKPYLKKIFWTTLILALILMWFVALDLGQTVESAWYVGSEWEYGTQEHMTMFANEYGEGWQLIY